MGTKKALLEHFGYKAEILHFDPNDKSGTHTVETVWDVSPIVEAAKILADEPPGKDFRHAAFIPEYVMDQAFREGWFNDPKKWKDWANNPENAAFRTWKGRL